MNVFVCLERANYASVHVLRVSNGLCMDREFRLFASDFPPSGE